MTDIRQIIDINIHEIPHKKKKQLSQCVVCLENISVPSSFPRSLCGKNIYAMTMIMTRRHKPKEPEDKNTKGHRVFSIEHNNINHNNINYNNISNVGVCDQCFLKHQKTLKQKNITVRFVIKCMCQDWNKLIPISEMKTRSYDNGWKWSSWSTSCGKYKCSQMWSQVVDMRAIAGCKLKVSTKRKPLKLDIQRRIRFHKVNSLFWETTQEITGVENNVMIIIADYWSSRWIFSSNTSAIQMEAQHFCAC